MSLGKQLKLLILTAGCYVTVSVSKNATVFCLSTDFLRV